MKTKDTAENRLKVIEILVGEDTGVDAGWYSICPEKTKKLGREKLIKLVLEFGKVITDCYIISHGFNSKCCKGIGKEIMETLLNLWNPKNKQ